MQTKPINRIFNDLKRLQWAHLSSFLSFIKYKDEYTYIVLRSHLSNSTKIYQSMLIPALPFILYNYVCTANLYCCKIEWHLDRRSIELEKCDIFSKNKHFSTFYWARRQKSLADIYKSKPGLSINDVGNFWHFYKKKSKSANLELPISYFFYTSPHHIDPYRQFEPPSPPLSCRRLLWTAPKSLLRFHGFLLTQLCFESLKKMLKQRTPKLDDCSWYCHLNIIYCQ